CARVGGGGYYSSSLDVW
nr:immunoglobulin heavy chain junction region [Macaca mulatta]